MIILDTNVLSALMQVAPDKAVVNWLDRQPAESIWITSVTLFEAHLGIALLARESASALWRQRSINCCHRIWETECLILIPVRRLRQRLWPPRGRKLGIRSTYATRRLLESPWRGAHRSLRETCATSRTLGYRWSIRGRVISSRPCLLRRRLSSPRPPARSRDPRKAVKYQLGVSMEIRHVPVRNRLGYVTSLANKLRINQWLASFLRLD